MPSPTWDHMAYVKPGQTFGLDWLETFMRSLPDLGGATVRRDNCGTLFGMRMPTIADRAKARLTGRSSWIDDTVRLFETPALAIEKSGVVLVANHSNHGHVAAEAAELSDSDGLDMTGVVARFEFSGLDRELVLAVPYTHIMNALHETGHFVLYSDQTGLWEPI